MRANRKRLPQAEENSLARWDRIARENIRKTTKLNQTELQHREAHLKEVAKKRARIPDDFPLELVANIAARLLQNEDYTNAVVRALGLLQECSQRLKANKEAKELCLAEYRFVNSPDFPMPKGLYKVPFGEAIKRITGQAKYGRAEVDYLRFLEAINPSQSKTERTAQLKNDEREGIDAALVQDLHARFEELRDRGNLGKRKRPEKNSLT